MWISLIFSFFAHATNDLNSAQESHFNQFFAEFSRDPQRAVQQIPPKFDRFGRIKSSLSKFSESDIKTRNFISQKDKAREGVFRGQQDLFAGFQENDNVDKFFPPGFSPVDQLDRLDQHRQVAVPIQPWSGDYWAMYRGGVGARYASNKFPDTDDWKDYSRTYKRYWPINFSNQQELDNLSPAEKYDILVGDDNFTFTQVAWSDGEQAFKETGKVEQWFGLCHGWAPAAINLPRPQQVFEVPITNFKGSNFTLKFFPDDIKALATALWANSTLQSYFLGGRCKEKDPKVDNQGRVLAQDCFDLNPGSWHLALINQVALAERSFVIDATYDYEVWNQPVASYRFRYFNPKTRKLVNSLEEGLVDVDSFTNDNFKSYRSSSAKKIVGVSMDLTYISETKAGHWQEDTSNRDDLTTVQYYYDLEISAEGKIIGGEWYQLAHPDFSWAVPARARAVSVVDHYLKEKWNPGSEVPLSWRRFAPLASSYAQPFAKVVEGLIERSRP